MRLMHYNIDTEKEDLVQIDCDGRWTVPPNCGAWITFVRFDPPDTEEGDVKIQQCSLRVTHNDLVKIRDQINVILGDTN